MANEQEAKTKLVLLATRVKGATTTYAEDTRLDAAIRARRIHNKADVAKVLEESLQKSANEVDLTLRSDDSDRLVDEIIQALGK